MVDNKDRQRQQVQRQRKRMKVVHLHQRDSSLATQTRQTQTQARPRRNSKRRIYSYDDDDDDYYYYEELEEEEEGEEEKEEENDDVGDADVAPKSITHGYTASDPSYSRYYSKNNKSPNSNSKKKKRKLEELPGANGEGVTPTVTAAGMDSRNENRNGSLFRSHEEKDKRNQNLDVTGSVPGTPYEPQSETPLPDKKVLLVALDKFQKKDTYGVFSEPVDPEELPDYFDIIENPMDFGTIRNNLERGNYRNLEQLEKDVLLVCSNAMSYNASGTVYYRQARAIQELAKKTFESLRCDPEGLEPEHERKPAVKTMPGPYSKRKSKRGARGRPRLEVARSDLASGASLASSGECAEWINDAAKLRRCSALDRPSTFLDGMGRSLQRHNSADVNSPAEHSEELSGSILKGTGSRDGRRDLSLEENRRDTYKPWNSLLSVNESIFATLTGNSKQLVNIGIQLEYGYARSLARFSAELGPAAWKIVAKKIEKSLPSTVPFGPGWVGEYDAPRSAFVLHEEHNNQQKSNICNVIPFDNGVDKVMHLTSDQEPAKKQDFEGQSHLSRNCISSSIAAPTFVVPATRSSGSPVTQSMGSHLASDKIIKSRAQVVKEGELKSASPVVESREVTLTDAKFGSDVSQSRLLEIVSRNNRLMQWTSTKPAEQAQPVSSLQASASCNIGAERRMDDTSNYKAKQSHDDIQQLSNSGATNITSSAVEPSAPNNEDSSRTTWAAQSTSSPGHGLQDLNWLVDSSRNKMPGLQRRVSNMSVNNPFGFSSVSSRHTTVSGGDAVAEAWARTRAADPVHADGGSRITTQIKSDTYFSSQQSEAKPSSSVPQFMQQQIPLDMSLYMLSPLGRMHAQNLSKIPQNISQVSGGQIADSLNSNTLGQFNNMQTTGGPESSQSQQYLWQSFNSKHPFQQTSDFLHSTPPDLNVVFQSPNSPVRQSSLVAPDSQPDLALQL